MTFKAAFPDIVARDRSGHGRPEAIKAVFVPQHTDFVRRYQRFAAGPRHRLAAQNRDSDLVIAVWGEAS
ncbi:MAG TPA: hypothetical protein VF922_00615 [Bradyrhizobium sp.]|jgi:hypothetical protein